MRTLINSLTGILRNPIAPDVAKGALGAGLSYFAAPIASRSFTGEEISPSAQAAVTAMGGAVGGGRFGKAARGLATRFVPTAGLAVALDSSQRSRQGFSMLDPNSMKQHAGKLFNEQVSGVVDKYLPQSALPDGTAHRTLSPAARAAVDKLVGRGVKPQQLLDSLGFQYSSLHGLAGTDAADRAATYLKGRSRYQVPTLG